MMGFLIAVAGITLLLGFLVIFLLLSSRSKESALLAQATSHMHGSGSAGLESGWFSAEHLAKPFEWFRSLFRGEPNPEIMRRLVLAGYRKPYHADVFTGVRLLLPVIFGGAVAIWIQNNVFIWFILAVTTGFFIPHIWLEQTTKKRRDDIKFALPDALDLLSICVEAGLGLDQALVRVGQEMEIRHPALSEEFSLINLEQRAGNPRIGAWRNMADRVDLENVRSFVNMLVQTERFGTPISKSLANFSDALRTQRRQQVEEAAAKTTIKLVFPLVLFIFPSIFVVTAAPAVITLMKGFGTVL
jgi:tight adherence protein C